MLVQNRTGAREATEHLIWHGHERIAFVGDEHHIYTARKRLDGMGSPNPRRLILPTELVVRESCGCSPQTTP